MFCGLLFLLVLALGRPQEQAAVNRLLQTLVEQCFAKGGWITRFDLRATEHGLGMVASRNMAAGETLAELPYALHLNQDAVGPFLPRSVLEAAVDPQVHVAVFLAMERFGVLPRRPARRLSWLRSWLEAGERVSQFASLADLMPPHVANAAHWSGAEWRVAEKLLAGPLGFVHDLDETWAALAGAGTGLTREQFLWGYSMLLSRSFKGSTKDWKRSFF